MDFEASILKDIVFCFGRDRSDTLAYLGEASNHSGAYLPAAKASFVWRGNCLIAYSVFNASVLLRKGQQMSSSTGLGSGVASPLASIVSRNSLLHVFAITGVQGTVGTTSYVHIVQF